jgi:hypothetical protein
MLCWKNIQTCNRSKRTRNVSSPRMELFVVCRGKKIKSMLKNSSLSFSYENSPKVHRVLRYKCDQATLPCLSLTAVSLFA